MNVNITLILVFFLLKCNVIKVSYSHIYVIMQKTIYILYVLSTLIKIFFILPLPSPISRDSNNEFTVYLQGWCAKTFAGK